MCARYTLVTPPSAFAPLFGLQEPLPALQPRYNIAPTQQVPVVRATPGGRSLSLLRWGFVPFWSKDAARPVLNARAETLFEKPTFRGAARQRRALLPADGFYEWRTEKGGKTAILFQREGGAPFAIAALWERWTSPDGVPMDTMALLTTQPNETVSPVHDRMPVILTEASAFSLWLDPAVTTPEALAPLFAPAPAGLLRARAVSRRVNSAVNDDPDCWADA